MNQRKRLAKPEDIQIKCSGPLPDNVMLERNKEYYKLSYVEFRKKYRHYLFTPATIEFSKNKYEVQMNFCNDTFCGNYGLPQLKFENIKGKPSRYRLTGAKEFSDESRLLCNEISVNPNRMPINNVTNTISNWSIVEEIKRLVTINTVVPIKPEYTFHKDKCNNKNKTPFDNAECFHKRGLTKSKSAKHQCKECKKITNVLPKQDQRFNYGQKRNDILLDLCKLLFSRTPVKRICENLNIGSKTFYNKLEWLYRKCLEFNQRYETKPLSDMTFNKL